MYTYRHKRNGSTFTTPCVCAGEEWEEVKPASSGKKKQRAAEPESADGGGEET